jgi:hypothetical protein
MVLTEWKVVHDSIDADEKATEARRQTNEYASGLLGDLELKRTRYIILVSDRQGVPPPDIEERGVCYRHIWLAVDPDSPSKHARRESKTRQTAGPKKS